MQLFKMNAESQRQGCHLDGHTGWKPQEFVFPRRVENREHYNSTLKSFHRHTPPSRAGAPGLHLAGGITLPGLPSSRRTETLPSCRRPPPYPALGPTETQRLQRPVSWLPGTRSQYSLPDPTHSLQSSDPVPSPWSPSPVPSLKSPVPAPNSQSPPLIPKSLKPVRSPYPNPRP